jgi:transcriptional regulator with XRE-family HTH domain
MNSDNITLKIAKKIKAIRLEKHLTQSDVADRARISTNYYAKLERAEAKPSVETLAGIVKALKVKSSDILPF